MSFSMRTCRSIVSVSKHNATLWLVVLAAVALAALPAKAQVAPSKGAEVAPQAQNQQGADAPRSPVAAENEKPAEPEPPPAPAIGVALATEARLQKILSGGVPQSVADLKAMQDRVRSLTDKLTAVTVGVRLPNGMGSGVIISEDGYVMTAGHVVDRPGKDVSIFLPDGKRLKAITLGANYGVDAGLIKITEQGKWPFAPLGDSSKLKEGQWCIAMGHPGGFEKERTPPLRLGRILEVTPRMIVTDCPLVGGDSGGPLFDLDGRVIGINSRIGNELYSNIHVPTGTYRETWQRLAKGESWGGRRPNGPFIGVIADRTAGTATIGDVVEGSPADEAGLKAGDVVLSFGGVPTPTFEALIDAVAEKDPGDRTKVEISRGGEKLELHVVVGRYGG